MEFQQLKRNLKKDISTLPTIKVSLTGDSATQFLAMAIKGMGIEKGYNIDLFESDYNQVERQVMDSTSNLYAHEAKYNIFFQSTHKLLEKYARLPVDQQITLADERLAMVRQICENVPGYIIYYNYPEIDNAVFGSYCNKVDCSFVYQIRKLNYELMNLAQEYKNLFICDLSSIQNKYGRNWLFDSVVYVNTEMLLSIDSLPVIAQKTMDIICANEGKIKKCVILDLDNTVWGGVVGDDGWENIQVGHGLGIGKAFSEFQLWLKTLKNRGIIICVCSKNDEDKAKEPFEKNPEMVLTLKDISVFVANWNNKADNIRSIQSILNIGFDSMVFLDDNPMEREIVRRELGSQGVAVPEMPEDPGAYLEYLYSQNLFETSSYSNADKDRTKQYQVEALRMAAAKKFTNEGDFLKSLQMVSEVSSFNKFNIPRVAQLSQRSNQFNLRTVRYTEDQIIAIENDPKQKGFAFTLEDKFGDNGLIAVIIMKEKDSDTLFIDTWFMSCRVLKRGMEYFTLNTIVTWAKENGYNKLIGEYLPTPKNNMVANHYSSLGFTKLEGTCTAQWILDIENYQNHECYIAVKK